MVDKPDEDEDENNKDPTKDPTKDRLWAVDALLDAVLVRFRYHFERPASATNRLAKPEWMLSHMLAQVRGHALFLAAVVSPALVDATTTQPNGSSMAAVVHCTDAQVLLLQALVYAAQRKLRTDLPRLVSVRRGH